MKTIGERAKELLAYIYKNPTPPLKPSKSKSKSEAEPGDLWMFGPVDDAEVAVITAVDEDVVIVKFITKKCGMATPEDMLVLKEELPDDVIFGELSSMIEGIEYQIPIGHLYNYLGEVSPELFAKIQSFNTWQDGFVDIKREFLGTARLVDCLAEKWEFIDHITGEKLLILAGQQWGGKENDKFIHKLDIEREKYLLSRLEQLSRLIYPLTLEKL